MSKDSASWSHYAVKHNAGDEEKQRDQSAQRSLRGIERANRNPLTTRIEGEIRSGLREMVACQTILGKFVRVKVMLHWGAVKHKVGDK